MKLLFGLFLSFLLGLSAHGDLSLKGTSLTGLAVNISPDSAPKLTVFCFLGTECPLAILYAPRLNEIEQEYQSKGVRLIGVMSNYQDSRKLIDDYILDTGINFPIFHDQNQKIADQFGATRTPEVFVLDRKLEIQYQGRIDDQYDPGISRAKPDRNDLRIAIEETLSGKPVSVPRTDAEGCLIGRAGRAKRISNEKVTYYKDVVPVLQKHCIECHRKGQIGPFSMSSYRRVSGWADTMLETIEDGRMPPWHADPAYGHFLNTRHMPESDKQVIRDWILAGKPEGIPADQPAPAQYLDGWQLGQEPDLILPMGKRPFSVPKTGTVDYQYFVVDPKFNEDKWIRAAEVIPGNRSVVHHVIVFVRPPDHVGFKGSSLITGYVPGQRIILPPITHARKVVAGSKLIFQIHYTPNGKHADDLTKIGLVFADERQVTHEMYSLIALEQEFEIPPNESNYRVQAKLRWMPKDGELLSIAPHMHYRGKSFNVYSSTDSSEPLLKVPNYDFNWQHTYILKEPIPLSKLNQIRFEASFDNSSENPFNPDPTKWIMWGDQTWEEMAVAFFEVAIPRQRSKSPPANRKPIGEETVDAYVSRCFREMDENGDGIIKQKEAPLAARLRWFAMIDQNRDKKVTREELRIASRRILR